LEKHQAMFFFILISVKWRWKD